MSTSKNNVSRCKSSTILPCSDHFPSHYREQLKQWEKDGNSNQLGKGSGQWWQLFLEAVRSCQVWYPSFVGMVRQVETFILPTHPRPSAELLGLNPTAASQAVPFFHSLTPAPKGWQQVTGATGGTNKIQLLLWPRWSLMCSPVTRPRSSCRGELFCRKNRNQAHAAWVEIPRLGNFRHFREPLWLENAAASSYHLKLLAVSPPFRISLLSQWKHRLQSVILVATSMEQIQLSDLSLTTSFRFTLVASLVIQPAEKPKPRILQIERGYQSERSAGQYITQKKQKILKNRPTSQFLPQNLKLRIPSVHFLPPMPWATLQKRKQFVHQITLNFQHCFPASSWSVGGTILCSDDVSVCLALAVAIFCTEWSQRSVHKLLYSNAEVIPVTHGISNARETDHGNGNVWSSIDQSYQR